jgi:hypothetical protein
VENGAFGAVLHLYSLIINVIVIESDAGAKQSQSRQELNILNSDGQLKE